MANLQTPLPLEDIVLAPTQGFWPLAPGWWVLIALALLAISWSIYQLIKKHRTMAFFRQQQKQLDLLEKQLRSNSLTYQQVLTTLNRLLKLLLVNYSQKQFIGKLTGQDLADWLDKQLTIPEKLCCLFDDSIFQQKTPTDTQNENSKHLSILSSYRDYQVRLVKVLLKQTAESKC